MGVLVFNPSLKDNRGTLNSNLGDLIISGAVIAELKRIFPNDELISISSHTQPDEAERSKIKTAQHRIVGGTNVLSSDMHRNRQWNFPGKVMAMNPAILCGVGWQNYQSSPSLFTRIVLKTILSRRHIHSVRDGYTKRKLAACGVRNVINTSCPTLWGFAGKKHTMNDRKPAKSVLLMLTDYRQDEKADHFLVNCLCDHYDGIYFWPQGEMDLDYLRGLLTGKTIKLVILDRTLEALDECLSSVADLDYVGTRLHGGIRCLIANKRSLILEVDNRAKEIAQETGLPALPRTDTANITKWIKTGWKSEIWVDDQPINQWRQQFAK